ncbi:MAG: Tat pathway signal sequence, partial [Phototrophicales bacterium]
MTTKLSRRRFLKVAAAGAGSIGAAALLRQCCP